MLEILKKRLINVAREAQRDGLCKNKSGNFSIRDKESGYILVSPSGVDREELEVDDICVVTIDGEIIYAKEGRKPTSETMMHLAIYRERSDVFSVVHTHSKMATSFAILKKPIPIIIYEIASLGLKESEIPVSDFAMPGTKALGDSVKPVVHKADVFLMEKHGAVAMGQEIEDTLLKAQYLEEVAEIYYNVLTINQGREPEFIDIEAINAWRYPENFK